MKFAWTLAALTVPIALQAQISITTNRYDPQRTGANLSETTLTTSNVNPTQFGKLYSYPVDGAVYAQPLYVPGVTVNGSRRNVLYVATMNDKVYAFDADSASASPLWMRDFTNPPSVTPVPITDIVSANLNVVGNVGIQSTPVIDRAAGTIYLLARTKESGAYVQRLHALDIATGTARPGSPVAISGSVPGTAPDSTPGATGRFISFNPKMQSQRAGLALSNGVVLVSWASHEDALPYHGWIMGFDSATLARVAIFAVTPDGYAGGIWQGGRAPTIDAAGNAYFSTGNGTWDGTRNFGNSLLKFSVSRSGLSLLDYFTPGNQADLNVRDDDLSGSGFTLLPGTNLLLGGGKEGVLYLLDANRLGGFVPNDTQIVQKLADSNGHVMGGPVYWNSASLGPLVYNWTEDDVLKAYRLSGGRLVTPPYTQGQVVSPGHPGGSLTISANGAADNTGIVWASMPATADALHGLRAGILRAYDAETLLEIWTSERNPGRDRAGTLMKFVPPVVANGRVYMPNHDNAVVVYGLLPVTPPPAAGAGVISVDFAGSSPGVMGTAETAGVVSRSHWNSAAGSARSTPLGLVDETGAPTNATITWASGGGNWMLPTTDQAGNARMMKGYLDTSSTVATSVTVAGLSQRLYDVYVYADGDNRDYTRGAAYTLSGPGITTATVNLVDPPATNFSGTFVQANGSTGNYVKFSVTATGFTLAAAPTTPETGSRRAPVNGIQIVPVVTASPDFTLTATPSSRTVTAGSSTTYSVTVAGKNGFSGTVSFGVSGAPAGTTATFAPASVTSGGTSTLNVTTSANTPAGTVTLTVTGTSGTLSRTTAVTLSVAAPPPTGGSGSIGINFVGGSPSSMAAAETAGVVAASHWNNAVGAARSTPLALVDDTGAATMATATWSAAGGVWMLPTTDQAGNPRMMKGYLDTNSTASTTVSVAGLPQRQYDVYVYADGDNRGYARGAAYTLSGAGITTTTINLVDPAGANFTTAFTRADNSGGNYVKFTIAATGFTLTAAPTTADTATRRAPVNGIQIVPVGTPPPPRPAIAIDFVGNNPAAMAPAETAGVVPKSHWNQASGSTRSTPLALVDDTGAATSAAVTWTANGTWMTPITDQAGNRRMMKGYLDTSSTSTTTVTVTGLPSGAYDVYVYADGHNYDFWRTAAYRISGAGVTPTTINLTDPASTNFDATFVAASGSNGNYVKFSVNATGFTLTATPGSGGNASLRAPVNGIQIVPK